MTEQLTKDHKHIKTGDLDVTIRPITSDDKEIEAAFMRDLSAQANHENFLDSGVLGTFRPNVTLIATGHAK